MTGTGTLSGDATNPPLNNLQILYFDGVFASLLPGFVNDTARLNSSTITLGGTAFDFAWTISTAFDYPGTSSGVYIGSGPFYSHGDALSAGSLQLNIFGATSSPVFAAAGATGDIHWGSSDNVTGSWAMVAVPEPATLAMMGLGLAALGMHRKRN